MNIVEKIIEENIPADSECVVYGISETGKRIIHYLKAADRKIKYIIDDFHINEKYEEYSVLDPYSVIYENDAYIVIACAKEQGKTIMRKKILDMGIQDDHILDITQKIWPSEGLCYFDSLLGPMPEKEYVLYDNGSNESLIIYGGSTSENGYSEFDCWSKVMASFNECEYSILNGATRGNTSIQEYRKCLRDSIPVKPRAIIVFSGINDALAYANKLCEDKEPLPSINEYIEQFVNELIKQNSSAIKGLTHGMVDNREPVDVWIENMRLLHAACGEFDIPLYVFLQPTITYGKYKISDFEKKYLSYHWGEEYCEYISTFFAEASKKIEKYDYMFDLTDCFEDKTDCYTDMVHYTYDANVSIATRVWEIITSFI